MKVTSFKELEGYIYASLVLPLKGFQNLIWKINSPLSGKNGNAWFLNLYQPSIANSYRHNYQRTLARRRRDYFFGLEVDYKLIVVGEYNVKNHWVKLYEQEFKQLNAMILLGRMVEVFDKDSLFTKVVIDRSERKTGINDTFGAFDTQTQPRLELAAQQQPVSAYQPRRDRDDSEPVAGFWDESDEDEDEDEDTWV